jgi:TetR/AcrR family transcriptional repressor of bet genes
MSRPSNTDERREQIAGALLRVMARKGYDGASIASVAAAARVAPGIVHYHFKDKQEILVTALRDLVSRYEAALDARESAAGSDPVRRILAFIDFHLGLGAESDPETLACWVMLSGEALRQPKIRAEYAGAMQSIARRLCTLIEEGQKQGELRCADATVAASALVAAVEGYYVLAAVARDVIPRGSAALAVRHMAEGLLQPRHPFPSGKSA